MDVQAALLHLSEAVRQSITPGADVGGVECLPLYSLVYGLCSPTASPGGDPAPASHAPYLYAHLRSLLFLHARASALLLARALPASSSVQFARHPLFAGASLPDLDPARVEREADRLRESLPEAAFGPLGTYAHLWGAFDSGIARVAAVFWHLDEDYIKENARSGQSTISDASDIMHGRSSNDRFSIFDVRSTALIAWRDEVIGLVGPVLLDRVLTVTASERRARLRGESTPVCSNETLRLIRVLLDSVVTIGSTSLLEAYDESISACTEASSDGIFKGLPESPHLSMGSTTPYIGLPEASQPPNPLRLTEAKRAPCVLFLYRELFERPFLEDVEQFYREQSVFMLETNKVAVRHYVQEMATAQLESEIDFAGRFADKSTMGPLRQVLEQVLIAGHKPRLLDAADRLLRNACTASLDAFQDAGGMEHLHDIYRLLASVADGVRPLQDLLRRHAAQAGMDRLREFTLHDGNLDALLAASAEGAGQATPAARFVRGAWDVLHRFQTITDVCFESNGGCQNALNQASEQFVNSFDAAPQLLAHFAHEVLENDAARGSRSAHPRRPLPEKEVEKWVTHTNRLFRHLHDKDIFQRVYAIRLTRRLICSTSRALSMEQFMLAQLAALCGPDYTSRLKRMFADVDASRTATAAFRRSREDAQSDPAYALDVLVVSATAWPVSGAGGVSGADGLDGPVDGDVAQLESPEALAAAAAFVALPARVGVACAQFVQHYMDTAGHARRRLTWMYHLCRVGLRAHLGRGRRRAAEIEVSLVQAAVLLQFNDSPRATVASLSHTLGIARAVIRSAVALLIRVEILADAVSSSRGLGDHSVIEVNDNATLPAGTLRVALLASDRPESAEVDTAKRGVERDRRTQIQACVVRKMKEAKILDEVDLFRRVVAELRLWFPVEHADIVRNVETLIENEYLARDGTVYSYVA